MKNHAFGSTVGSHNALKAKYLSDVAEKTGDQKNVGGLGGGLEYTGTKLVTGAESVFEGLGDFVGITVNKIAGNSDKAEYLAGDSSVNFKDQLATAKYNPGKGMNVVGTLATGMGQTAAYAGLQFLTAGIPFASFGTMATSAAGNYLSEAYNKTGKIGKNEYLYAIPMGLVEGFLEMETGPGAWLTGKPIQGKVLGKLFSKAGTSAIGNFAEKAVTSALGEGLEEGVSAILSAPVQNWSGVDKNAKIDWKQVAEDALYGALSGALLGGGGAIVGNTYSKYIGNQMSKNPNYVANKITEAQELVKLAKGKGQSEIVTNINKMLEAYQKHTAENTGYVDAYALGRLNQALAEAEATMGMLDAKGELLVTLSDPEKAAEISNIMKVSVDDLLANKDGVLDYLAAQKFVQDITAATMDDLTANQKQKKQRFEDAINEALGGKKTAAQTTAQANTVETISTEQNSAADAQTANTAQNVQTADTAPATLENYVFDDARETQTFKAKDGSVVVVQKTEDGKFRVGFTDNAMWEKGQMRVDQRLLNKAQATTLLDQMRERERNSASAAGAIQKPRTTRASGLDVTPTNTQAQKTETKKAPAKVTNDDRLSVSKTTTLADYKFDPKKPIQGFRTQDGAVVIVTKDNDGIFHVGYADASLLNNNKMLVEQRTLGEKGVDNLLSRMEKRDVLGGSVRDQLVNTRTVSMSEEIKNTILAADDTISNPTEIKTKKKYKPSTGAKYAIDLDDARQKALEGKALTEEEQAALDQEAETASADLKNTESQTIANEGAPTEKIGSRLYPDDLISRARKALKKYEKQTGGFDFLPTAQKMQILDSMQAAIDANLKDGEVLAVGNIAYRAKIDVRFVDFAEYVNPTSAKAINKSKDRLVAIDINQKGKVSSLLMHEAFHQLVADKFYGNVPRALKTRLDKIMTPEERKEVEDAYKAIGEKNENTIEEEVYAHGIEKAFASQSFLDDGVGRGYLGQIWQRFKRIIAWIGGTTEYRRMRSVATAMQTALDTRTPVAVDVETAELSDVKYSKKSFSDQVDEVISNTFDRENAVYVGKLPKNLADVGLDADLPMLTTASHISKAILPKNSEKHQHGLSVGQIKSIPSMLENPVMILDSLNTQSNSVVVVTSMVDEEKCPVIVTIKTDGKGMFNSVEIDSNFITSYYGRNRFDTFIEKNIKADNILFVNKEKADVLQTESGTQWLEQLKDINFDTIIRKTRSFVNTKSEKNQKNSDVRHSIDESSDVQELYERAAQSRDAYYKAVEKKKQIEKSEEFNKYVEAITSAKGDDFDRAISEYNQWNEKIGYSDISDEIKRLEQEYKDLSKQAEALRAQNLLNEERKNIEQSGLSEPEYRIQQAVKEFGYTPYFYDAGYILPNGKMLNFSGEKGKHFSSRGQDHRAIGSIYADKQGSQAMLAFMKNGNIRIMGETPGIDISVGTQLTKEQYATLSRFIQQARKEEYFAIDFTDERGNTIANLEYEDNFSPVRVINDIKHYLETGEAIEQSIVSEFHYSIDLDAVNAASGDTRFALERDENGNLVINSNERDGRIDFDTPDDELAWYLDQQMQEEEDRLRAYRPHIDDLPEYIRGSRDYIAEKQNMYAAALRAEETAKAKGSENPYVNPQFYPTLAKTLTRDATRITYLQDNLTISDKHSVRIDGNVRISVEGKIETLTKNSSTMKTNVLHANCNQIARDILENSYYGSNKGAIRNGQKLTEALTQKQMEQARLQLGQYLFERISNGHAQAITDAINRLEKMQIDAAMEKSQAHVDRARSRAEVKAANIETAEYKAYSMMFPKTVLNVKDLYAILFHRTYMGADALSDPELKRTFSELAKSAKFGKLRVEDVKNAMEHLLKWYTPENRKISNMTEDENGNPVSAPRREYSITFGPEEKQLNFEIGGFDFAVDPQMMQNIADLAYMNVSDADRDLNFDELSKLYQIVGMVKHVVLDHDKVIYNGKYVETTQIANEAAKQQKNAAKIISGKAMKRFNSAHVTIEGKQYKFRNYILNIADPHTVARYFDMYTENGFFATIFDQLSNAESMKAGFYAKWMQEFVDYYKANKYEKRLAEKIEIRAGMEMTVNQAISLYCLWKRPQANLGLTKAGIRWANPDTKSATAELTLKQITQKDIDNIALSFTKEDKQYVKMLENFFNGTSKEEYTKAEMSYFGYTNASDEYYFPIMRDPATIAKTLVEGKTLTDNLSLFRLGMTKNVKEGAKNALYIGNASDVLTSHANSLSTYVTMYEPLRTLDRVMNRNLGTGTDDVKTVKQDLKDNFGGEAVQYIVNLAHDVQGLTNRNSSTSAVDPLLHKLRSNLARAALAANVKVVFTQFASYPTAGCFIGGKYLSQAMSVDMSNDNRAKIYKSLDEHSDLARARAFSEEAVSAQINDDLKRKTKRFIDWTQSGITKMDRFTIGRIWVAAQLQIADETGLAYGTEENMQAAAKLFDDTVRLTQPMYQASERSAFMRNPSELSKGLAMFTTVAMKQGSRVFDTAMCLAVKSEAQKMGLATTAEVTNAKKAFGRTAVAVGLANLMYVAMCQIWKTLTAADRDDDGQKDTFGAIAKDGVKDYVTTSLSMFPVVGDIIELGIPSLEGYDISDGALDMVNDLAKDTVGFITASLKFGNGEIDQKAWNGKFRKWIVTTSTFGGVPTRNVYNLTHGVTTRMIPSAGYAWDDFFGYSSYSKDVVGAIKDGNEALSGTIMRLMVKDRTSGLIDSENAGKIASLYYDAETDKKYSSFVPSNIGNTVKNAEGEEITLTKNQKQEMRKIYAEADEPIAKMMRSAAFTNADADTQRKALSIVWDVYLEKAKAKVGGAATTKLTTLAEAGKIEELAPIAAHAYYMTVDKDANGKTISGSRRKKIVGYLQTIGLTKAEYDALMNYLGFTT